MIWHQLDTRATKYHLGYIPNFLSDDNPASAAEQFNQNYAHGGGWQPFHQDKWQMNVDRSIKYPGDPDLPPLFFTVLHKGEPNQERIYVYPSAMVAIVQLDDTFEVARLD